VPREPEAEESLAALLARREQVRSTHTPTAQPDPSLFRPQKEVVLPRASDELPMGSIGKPAEPESETKPEAPQQTTTTSRLLDAKRRAQRRKE
jgi:hypothetical protein